MLKKSTYYIAIILLFCCCKGGNNYIDNTISVDFTNIKYNEIIEDTLTLEEPFTGDVCIKDSILLMYSNRYTDKLLRVFNINTGKRIASLLPIGNSRNEYNRNCRIYIDLYQTDNEELGLWLYDRIKEEFQLINITKSIRENTTVVDSIIEYNNLRNGFEHTFGKVIFTDKYILARMQEVATFESEIYTPVKYYRCRVSSNKLEIESGINIYNRGISTKKNIHALSSVDTYNDKTKQLVTAMAFLPQLNIVDLDTEQVVGICYKPDVSFVDVLKNRKNDNWINLSITFNDKHIYVLTTEGEKKDD